MLLRQNIQSIHHLRPLAAQLPEGTLALRAQLIIFARARFVRIPEHFPAGLASPAAAAKDRGIGIDREPFPQARRPLNSRIAAELAQHRQDDRPRRSSCTKPLTVSSSSPIAVSPDQQYTVYNTVLSIYHYINIFDILIYRSTGEADTCFTVQSSRHEFVQSEAQHRPAARRQLRVKADSGLRPGSGKRAYSPSASCI